MLHAAMPDKQLLANWQLVHVARLASLMADITYQCCCEVQMSNLTKYRKQAQRIFLDIMKHYLYLVVCSTMPCLKNKSAFKVAKKRTKRDDRLALEEGTGI